MADQNQTAERMWWDDGRPGARRWASFGPHNVPISRHTAVTEEEAIAKFAEGLIGWRWLQERGWKMKVVS